MKNTNFDHVVMAANEDPMYIDFWPIAAWANRCVLGAEPILAFLTDRAEDDPYVAELRRHGEVRLYPTIPGIPDCNMAKMARSILCSQMLDTTVCYLQDIDLLPLHRGWVDDKVSVRTPGKLLLVGAEVYGAVTPEKKVTTSVPASMMTAESQVWRKLINPDKLPYKELAASWAANPFRGHNEDITTRTYHESGGCFSDEKFMRTLRLRHGVQAQHVDRGYDVQRDTIDRSCWLLDQARLRAGEYLESHLPRPLLRCRRQIEPLIAFISHKYGGGTLPLAPSLDLGYQRSRYRFGEDCLSEELFDFINVDGGKGAILLIGSSERTAQYLDEHWRVVALDERGGWQGHQNAYLKQVPIRGGWYNADVIKADPELTKYDYHHVIVEGPMDPALRKNLVGQPGLFSTRSILVPGTTPVLRAAATEIAVGFGMRVTEHATFTELRR